MDSWHLGRPGSALLCVQERLDQLQVTAASTWHTPESEDQREAAASLHFYMLPLTFPFFPFCHSTSSTWATFIFRILPCQFFFLIFIKFCLCIFRRCTRFLSLEFLFHCLEHSFCCCFLYHLTSPLCSSCTFLLYFIFLLYLFIYDFTHTSNNFYFMLHSTLFCNVLFYGYW